MSDRLRSMQRILALQAQRKRLAEWQLAAVEARRAAVAAARTELAAFVEAETPAGLLATLAVTQTRRLAERDALAQDERTRQHAAVQAAERRHRLAERLTDAVAADHRRQQERRSLEQLIERAVAREGRDGSD